jgi:hypothetical protein
MNKQPGKPKTTKVYRTGTPVAHKNMRLDPTGYVNREVNKGSLIQPSSHRSGMAAKSLQRAAQRRQQNKKRFKTFSLRGGK